MVQYGVSYGTKAAVAVTSGTSPNIKDCNGPGPAMTADKTPSRGRSHGSWAIPIIDGKRRVVGWSDKQPILKGNDLRHPDAERLLGAPLGTVEIELTDPEDVRRAGAPSPWQGSWRCLAICRRDDAAVGFELSPGAVPAEAHSGRKPMRRSGQD